MITIQVINCGDDNTATVQFLDPDDPDYVIAVTYAKQADARKRDTVHVKAVTKTGPPKQRRTETITQRAVKIG